MFGEDLESTRSERLIDFRLNEDAATWEVFSYGEAEIDEKARKVEGRCWEPTILTQDEFILVNWICEHDDVVDAECGSQGCRRKGLGRRSTA